jgi:hypothetical protein
LYTTITIILNILIITIRRRRAEDRRQKNLKADPRNDGWMEYSKI